MTQQIGIGISRRKVCLFLKTKLNGERTKNKTERTCSKSYTNKEYKSVAYSVASLLSNVPCFKLFSTS